MGNGRSRLESALAEGGGEEGTSQQMRFFGLVNLGNTCYCNSVMQALYSCNAFRKAVLRWYAQQPSSRHEDLLLCLGELFASIERSSRRTGRLAPSRFVERVRSDNELFSSRSAHQDAHEFLNFLLNALDDSLERELSQSSSEASPEPAKCSSSSSSSSPSKHKKGSSNTSTESQGTSSAPSHNFVKSLFQGKLVSRTRCLWCENVSVREESYLDLSLDVERNSSLSSCLRNFSRQELLAGSEKFHCDTCCGLQEAQRRMLIKHAPPVLALHLKRFKFFENGRYRKVTQRVAFPQELKLCNITEDSNAKDVPYDLFAVVVHKGRTLNFGHYISLVRGANGCWVRFDDDEVDLEDEFAPESVFGAPQEDEPEAASDVANGYILLYSQRSALDWDESGECLKANGRVGVG